MASQHDTAMRKRELITNLLASIARGALAPGAQIPGLGDLARRHQLSKPTALEALRPLIADGTLLVKPSVGIFVGARTATRERYVVTVGSRCRVESWPLSLSVLRGFEERLTTLGGASVVVEVADLVATESMRDLTGIVGIFIYDGDRAAEIRSAISPAIPVVQYLAGQPVHDDGAADDERLLRFVDLDNQDGGRVATEELLRHGFERIAYLGLHGVDESSFSWSRQRRDGWRAALRQHRPRAPQVELVPDRPPQPLRHADDIVRDAIDRSTKVAMSRITEFDACVCADDNLVTSLTDALVREDVDPSVWPILVGFEGTAGAMPHVLTSVRPRWQDLGSSAADLLFDAAAGHFRKRDHLTRIPMVTAR